MPRDSRAPPQTDDGFGGGVPEVRNARASDSVYAAAIEAIFFKEDAARAHCRWRSVHVHRGRRKSLMSEAWNIQLSSATNGEGENAAKTGSDWPSSRWIDDPGCAAPSHHQRQK